MSTTTYDYPGGDVYAQAQLSANTAYQNAVVRLNQQRTSTLGQYGYQGTIDPTSGAIGNLRVDPNNPYGSYQQLLRSSAREAETATDSAAARGVSGGLAEQGDQQAKYDYGQGASQLGTSLQNTLGGYDTSQVDAANQRDQQVTQAQQASAANALQWQLSQAQLGALQAALKASQAQVAQRSSSPAPGAASESGGPPSDNPPSGPPGSPDSSNPGSGDVNQQQLNQYVATPVGQRMIQQVQAHPASAGSSGAAGVLTRQTKKNYQAARNAV